MLYSKELTKAVIVQAAQTVALATQATQTPSSEQTIQTTDAEIQAELPTVDQQQLDQLSAGTCASHLPA